MSLWNVPSRVSVYLSGIKCILNQIQFVYSIFLSFLEGKKNNRVVLYNRAMPQHNRGFLCRYC